MYQNQFFIGQRVTWEQAAGRNAGAGVIDSIRLSMNDRLVYRVEREKLVNSQLYELLHEDEMRAAK